MTVYLACLMFGGTLLLVAIFMGDGGDGDVDFSADADADMSFDVEHDVHVEAHGEGLAAAVQYFSFKNLIFFTAFFGLTGTALTLLDTIGAVVLPVAITMGVIASVISHRVMVYLKDSESGQVGSLKDLEGLPAKVIVGVGKDSNGKIMVSTDEQTTELLAMVAEEASVAEFASGDSVTIVKIVNGVAHVASENFIG